MRQPKIRSVGPAFFTDEEVVKLSPNARLALIALACMADDQGVFRWKPLQVCGFAFPGDGVNIHDLLDELISLDLVRRYEADDSAFGAIRGWGRHQKPRDARALHPLPEELDVFVRFDDIPIPRVRQDRLPPVWPRRPKADKAPGQRLSKLPPTDVPGTSHGEGRGPEWSGKEGTGQPSPTNANPASPERSDGKGHWPGEFSQELSKRLHDRLLGPLEKFAWSKSHLSKVKPRDLQRGLVQAIVRLSPFEATNPSLLRLLSSDDAARDKTMGLVKAWLARVDDGANAARSKPSFLAASMRRGPSAGWELPGFGMQPVNGEAKP